MLNIGRLGVDGAEYYLDTVASGAEEYYLGAGEAPGEWTGSQAAALGLAGEVTPEALRAVLAGVDPSSGERLGSGRPRTVPGFDLTLRAPKSVSLLWGLGGPLVADEVRRSHDAAVAAAVGYLEAHAVRSRRGAGGTERVAVGGFVGAAFRHRSSRAGDPLLHTHVVVANLARAVDDGRWRTLDSRRLYAHAKTAGYVYQAALRHELTRRLEVAWKPVGNGWADLAGIPDRVIRAFSQRRAEIEAHMAARGETSAAAAQTATLVTRRAKDRTVTLATLQQQWHDRAETIGFYDHQLHRVTGRTRQPVRSIEEIAAELLGPEGLTATASTFDRRDVVQGWCDRLPAGAPATQIEQLTEWLLAAGNRDLVRLDSPDADPRWTTRDLLAVERQALDDATGRRDAQAGVADPAAVEAATARRPSLSDEQTAMVRELVTSGRGVEVVVGKAGAGKTFALDAARDAWTASGYRVVGCALAARAAVELHAGAGIPSGTLHRLLADLDTSRHLAPDSVVVVDEAGMVGTRKLARLLDHAKMACAKVVLVGDPHQLPAVDAGGLLAGLVARLRVLELSENRRQHHGWERDALDELRAGDPDRAVAAYRSHDRIVAAGTADAAREALVGDWWAARDEHGTEAVMIAARRGDVDDLNARARHRMAATGQLTGPIFHTDDRSFQAGDDVVCLRNNRRLGVTNGTRGTIIAVDADRRTITLTTAAGATVTLPASYIDALDLTHGYAMTGHKAQGMTCNQAFVLGSDSLYREWGYTALSRGRHTNRLYLVSGSDSGRDDAHTHSLGNPGPLRRLGDNLRRSRGQTLAIDHNPTPVRTVDGREERRRRLETHRDDLAARLEDRRSELADLDARLAETSRGLHRYTRRNDRQALQQHRGHLVGDVSHLTDEVRRLDQRIHLFDQDEYNLAPAVNSHLHAHGLDRTDTRARPETATLPAHEEPGLEIA